MTRYCLTYGFYQGFKRLEGREQAAAFSAIERWLEDPLDETLERRRVSLGDVPCWCIRASEHTQVLVSHHGEATTLEQILGPPRPTDTIAASRPDVADTRRSRTLSAAEIRQLDALPLRDWEWVLFLDEEQRLAVEASFARVARISGPVGSGKTVVALHRAALMANRARTAQSPEDRLPVLFTSGIRSVPSLASDQYRRMPDAVENGVEFMHVYQVAGAILKDAGFQTTLDERAQWSSLNEAMTEVIRVDSPLDRARLTRDDFMEEIEQVIKGQAAPSADEYCDGLQLGRGLKLDRELRRAIWRLYEVYASKLEARGTVSAADRIRLALEQQRCAGSPRYCSAVVDEAQELTPAQLELICATVDGTEVSRDRPDGVLLVGDSSQRISAGVPLGWLDGGGQGSSVVLRRNWRNTQQIMQASLACVGEFEVASASHSHTLRRSDVEMEVPRCGPLPRLVRALDLEDQAAYVADQILEYCAVTETSALDAGVLTYDGSDAEVVQQHLRGADIEFKRIRRAGPFSSHGVRVATLERAKGLEFAVAFVVGASLGGWMHRDTVGFVDAPAADLKAQRALSASRLYVAMTRAKDVLHVCFAGQPSPLLRNGLNHFELVKTDAVIRQEEHLEHPPSPSPAMPLTSRSNITGVEHR